MSCTGTTLTPVLLLSTLVIWDCANCLCPNPPGSLKFNSTITKLLDQRRKEPFPHIKGVCAFSKVKAELAFDSMFQAAPLILIVNKTADVVPLCCFGFALDWTGKCSPVCPGSCKKGMCINPNQCVCYEGHGLNSYGDCVLKCPCGCENGRCRGKKCECLEGFEFDDMQMSCVPTCKRGCQNGKCVAPNMCICGRGYLWHKTGKCVPACPSSCENGHCTKDNQCICDAGYRKDPRKMTCVPVCNPPCENGVCVSPDRCHCNEGYILTENKTCNITHFYNYKYDSKKSG
ncbi:hypothetical protein C0J52_02196 [Blattella germanica]|nr:hypothetical protein C0J52_02196 [Blattella germanica]